jgi:hypothetical protein
VCLEEGTQSEWLTDLLWPLAEELVVFVPDRRRGNKSDLSDAWKAAEGVRLNAHTTRVYKPGRELSRLRAAVRGYGMVTDDVVRTKNRIRAAYRSHGLHTPGGELFRPVARKQWEQKLPAALRKQVRLLGSELDALLPLQLEAKQHLCTEARQHPAVRWLMTAPAIKEVRAAQIVAVVGTPWRFRTKRQFWSYCGLGIVMRSTANWAYTPDGRRVKVQSEQTRGLNRKRNPLLKDVFKGAATQVCTRMREHPLHQQYQRLVEAGTKPNLAKLTIARHIAAATLAVWKHEEDYDPERVGKEPR